MIGVFGVLLLTGCGLQSDRPAANDLSAAMSNTGSSEDEVVGDPIQPYFELFARHSNTGLAALKMIEQDWQPGSAAILVESLSFYQNPEIREEVVRSLKEQTGQDLDTDEQWQRWLWREKPESHPEYMRFKARLYTNMDTRFLEYFDNRPPSSIRLDEVIWGGVARDGIPPLKNPKMVPADKATYLRDSNVVFGVVINGDARAYPKRILGWHEMFKDTIGGVSVNGVYCTLCGSMIVYETVVDGTHHELGTSGFLYRSNKLMYDRATKSLWATLEGTPVVGPLVGSGIRLPRREVVTATWGDWRTRHPDSKVLAINTGFNRNYREGEAYREYFANDDLMFEVPVIDERLPKKRLILALRADRPPFHPLAIDTEFLQKNSVYHDEVDGQAIVVLTHVSHLNEASEGGESTQLGPVSSRVYLSQGTRFVSWDGTTAIDDRGESWVVQEQALVRGTQAEPAFASLPRVPAHQAFWFGWHAAFPTTRLIK